MRPLLSGVGALVLGVSVFAAAPPSGVPGEVRRLIEQLGDDDLETRKAAAKKLEDIGEDAIGPLRRASRQHPDVDVRLRAGVVAAAIAKARLGEVRIFQDTGWVTRLVILPDGKHAISSSNSVQMWDLQTGMVVRRFGEGGWGLSVSKGGKRVATGRADGCLRVFEVETGKLLRTFRAHGAYLWGAGLSSDGKLAVSGANEIGLRLWDVENNRPLPGFKGVTDYCRCLAWSPDDKTVAVGHFASAGEKWRGILRLWDVKTGTALWEARGPQDVITSVAFSPDGKQVATSSFDKTIRVHDAATGKELHAIVASPRGLEGVAFSPDGKQVVSAGMDGDRTVRVWDVATGAQVRRFDGHSDGPLAVAVTPDGKYALSCAKDATLRLWPMPARRPRLKE